jgi:hypothetical protein
LDLSSYELVLGGPEAKQPLALSEAVASKLIDGFCVAYGTRAVLARHGLALPAAAERGGELLESVFRSAMSLIDMSRYSVTQRAMQLARMDVDGFNLNRNFSHDGQIASRAFMTTKCLHFDAATPFTANIYGPNDNIGGGFPLLCDAPQYCRDRGVDPAKLVESIPNNYNIAVRAEHYDELLENYSYALELDMTTDMVIVMLLNEIAFGVAHGATDPWQLDRTKPSRRPIRHIEYQYQSEEHYGEWYEHYSVAMAQAKDYQGENLSLSYHGEARKPFDRILSVPAQRG